jgi:zinc transport system ATP-binding protein
MGFYSPNKGTITRKKNLKIGYVPQRFVPDATLPLTVQRFLTLRKKTDVIRMRETAEEIEISSLLNKPLYTLSGGEMQRVLLARSLLGNPELLILDEPAQNLDISGQLAFYKLLEQVYNKHTLSILMVSHDLHMVMASTKHVLCLFHHVCCSGEPHVVTQDPEFITLFGSDMAHMMAVYQHNHHHSPNGNNHE